MKARVTARAPAPQGHLHSRVTLRERARYRVDRMFSRGTWVLMGLLLVGTLLLVAAMTTVVALARLHPPLETGSEANAAQAFWTTLMHTFDPSLIAYDTDGSRPYLGAMLVVTVGGVLSVGSLFGIMTNGVAIKLDALRKGRSRVVEKNHVIVLGWSSVAVEVIRELVEARKADAIVLLAPKDKVEMEDELHERIPDRGGARIVCRRGDPIVPSDVALSRPETARSIIVLAPPIPDPDIQVIKTVLALCGDMRRRGLRYDMVAQLMDPKNLPAARLAGGEHVHYVVTRDVSARVAVQACRVSGLCLVYHELFNFHGSEIYLRPEPSLVGRTFTEIVLMYSEAAVFGFLRAGGKPELAPDGAATLEEGDAVVFVAEDLHTARVSQKLPAEYDQDAMTPSERWSSLAAERLLVLGWNERGAVVVQHLEKYAPPGSEVVVVADDHAAESFVERLETGKRGVRVRFKRGEPSDRAVLDRLAVAKYQHVLTLSPAERYPPQEADARTLITLLHLRDIGAKTGGQFTIVSEMLDGANRDVADHATADDFIVSEELISNIIAQESQNPSIRPVIAELLGNEGASIYLVRASDYVRLDHPVDFYAVAASAVRRGEAAIGYRKAGTTGVCLNPRKSAKVTFQERDTIIVVAHGA